MSIPPKSDLSPETIEQTIIADKELRVGLDAQLRKLRGLPPSREHALAITKIEEGVMWLGMSLKSLNQMREVPQASPYPDSYNPANTKVAPTADGVFRE